MSFFAELEAELNRTMQADRHRLRNRLRGLRKLEEDGQSFDRPLEEFLNDLQRSTANYAARSQALPRVAYDESLPVVARKDEILRTIAENQVVVVCGETGSGKSTQLPKICLELGRGVSGTIGHTQPRRIAARSVAARVAEELHTELGSVVGFKVRFNDKTSPTTLVKLMTDGVLLAESQHDRWLDQYDTIIIDEAHERSLNIDFLLGYLKRLLPQRPDLKLIITSATIDAVRFAHHFGEGALNAEGESPNPAPVVEVSGRSYPIELRYRPPELDEFTGEPDEDRAILAAVQELADEGPGDMLVFLPTERDILAVHQQLRGWAKGQYRASSWEILPLYARLSAADQQRVFQPAKGRRIVLATNVAESSLTVPGIRYVIDTGTARISRYSPRSKVQRLPVEAISQASADQRKGRCGRVGAGICVRLYEEADFTSRERFTAPEIQRTNLAAVILQTQALGLGAIEDFPFLDPPRAEAIRDGYRTLEELGAFSERKELTPIGRQLARLPVDPRIGRMLLEAHTEHCLADLLIIAAALETQDPRERPTDKQQLADQAHAKFTDPQSDFVSLLRLWDFYQRLKQTLSRNQLRKACRQNFLSDVRMHEWHDLHRQLLEVATQAGMKAGKRRFISAGDFPGDNLVPPTEYAALHRAILAGLLSNIAMRADTDYQAANNQRTALWPGSGIFAEKPKWIVAAELLETTRRYARVAARIDPDWLEPLAAHLVNRSYSEPHWNEQAGAAMAFEKVSLFGLTIVPKRRVKYGHIDPKFSRDLLIREGLVNGTLRTRGHFLRENQKLLDEIASLGAKTRRRDWLIDEDRLVQFYHRRVPADVFDTPRFEKWRQQAERTDPRVLCMQLADVLPEASDVEQDAFPDQIEIGRSKWRLDYHFEPGDERDGITLTVPQAGVRQLSAERLGWLIPGLLADKIEALIRVLPKAQRRLLMPVPEMARRAADSLTFGSGEFLPAVANALSQLAGESITPDAFDTSRIPLHFQMNVRVVDHRGKPVAEGRDLPQLWTELGTQAEAAPLPDMPRQWHRDSVTKWDFGTLPSEIEIPAKPHRIVKYVAIVDQGETAGLRLVDSAEEAQRRTQAGLLRLLVLHERRELKSQVDWLPGKDQLALFASPWCTERSFDAQVLDRLAGLAWKGAGYRETRSAEEFELLRKDVRREIAPATAELIRVLKPICENFQRVRTALDAKHPVNWATSLTDIRQQLADLTPTGFLTTTPTAWFEHLPRYLQGIHQRLQKLSGGLPRDLTQLKQLEPFLKLWRERLAANQTRQIVDAELTQYRWMLEEFRISLFAQELGTSQPVSAKRLEKQWEKVQK